MILDILARLATAQQVTADVEGAYSYDTGNTTPKRKVAAGEPLCVVVAITAVGTNTGSAKLQAIRSAAATLSSPQIIGEVDLAAADIVAGATFIIPLGQAGSALRYLGVYFDITGTVDFTVDAYLQPLSMANVKPETYAKGYTIS